MDNQSTPKAEAKQDGQRFYHAQTGWQLIVSLSADEMECLAHLDIKPEGTAPGIDEIKGLLASDGICVGIDEAGIERLLAEIRPGKNATGTVACGLPAQPGENGRLVYGNEAATDSTANNEQTDQSLSEHSIDFRNVQQFINVEPDQEIGRILSPTSGTPGRTVRNKPVPAEPGKPLQLKPGQNVRAGGENGELLFAELHGRVKLEGDTIQVVEEYVVDGDVDFSIGNIRFNGFVEIRGDVLDGFQVSASKGLKITGNIGACRLISHGNIEFCGMDAQGKGSILCGGSLSAQFIHDCSVECWGSLQVAVELRNCTIHCRSVIITGQLAGGQYVALSGIEAKRLGAPSAVKTHLHSGVDYHDLDRMQVLLKQLEELQEKMGRTKEVTALNQLGIEKQRLMAAIIEVRNRRPTGSNAKVNVKDRIHEGVTICLGSAVEEFSCIEEGPVSLIENSNEGGLRRLSLSSLEVAAQDLEQAWLTRQEQERQEQEAAALEQQTEEGPAEELPEG